MAYIGTNLTDSAFVFNRSLDTKLTYFVGAIYSQWADGNATFHGLKLYTGADKASIIPKYRYHP